MRASSSTVFARTVIQRRPMNHISPRYHLISASSLLVLVASLVLAQATSVTPSTNASYKDPDPAEFTKRFETESREIFANRDKIIDTCRVKPGIRIADVGAGTGLFTRLFAKEVGPQGKVYAVDIARNF